MSRYGRASASQRGYDSRWRKARLVYLMRNPLCAMCQAPAEVVDHIIPHKLWDAVQSGDDKAIGAAQKLFWDQGNWQPLCKTCHDSDKQRQERGTPIVGCDEDGWPIG